MHWEKTELGAPGRFDVAFTVFFAKWGLAP